MQFVSDHPFFSVYLVLLLLWVLVRSIAARRRLPMVEVDAG